MNTLTQDAADLRRPEHLRRDTHRITLRDRQEADLLQRAIARAKEGDPSALDFLYVRYADDVCGYVQSIVRDRFEAEDITQTLFSKLLTKIRRYEQREVPFSAWILRVARNAALDHIRSRRMVPVEEVRVSNDGQDELRFDRYSSLRDALAQLPEQQREVLVLRHVAGLTPLEIARHMDKTESSVHGLHHRGRGALQAALRELEAAPVVQTGGAAA
jgi:RNA polymerase sigma-70 factor (ECF subfamily)